MRSHRYLFSQGKLSTKLSCESESFCNSEMACWGERPSGGGGCTRDALHGIRLLYKISKRLILDYS